MDKKIIVKKVRKYVPVRMPLDVYEDAVKSQRKLNKTASELLGKPIRIPLTRVFRIKMKMPTTISNKIIKKIVRGESVI